MVRGLLDRLALSISEPMKTLAEEIRQFCSAHRLRLNTDLGQHFLIDAEVLNRIIQAAKIAAGETIVEIGPGIGVLTRELLKQGAHVTAIELDERMLPLLNKFIEDSSVSSASSVSSVSSPRLTLLNANALHVDMPQTPYKVVANIPYHITSPLLHHLFLESSHPPMSLTLLLQREVAEKICQAPARTLSDPEQAKRDEGESKGVKGNAGMLTILVALFGTPRLVTKVSPDSFLPPPKVDSAVLHITCFEKPLAEPNIIESLFRLTKIAFGQKRKMLRNTLGAFHGGMERLTGLSIAPTRRPQTLSIQEWIALARSWPDNDGA